MRRAEAVGLVALERFFNLHSFYVNFNPTCYKKLMKALIVVLLMFSNLLASELKVESISIKDIGHPKGLRSLVGDYIVEVKVKNVSEESIEIQNYSVSTYFEIIDEEIDNKELELDLDFYTYNGISCHKPTFRNIKKDEILTLIFKESAKNRGKEKVIKVKTKEGLLEVSKYVVAITD